MKLKIVIRAPKIPGINILKFAQGQYNYTGSWKENQMDGEGKIAFANGNHYEGGFKESKFHGQV